MAERANITPKVLKWARESARISEEDAAKKVSVSAEKIKSWEEGMAQPTIRQAKDLARAYRRPFALLFLPDIPDDFQPLQDYRSQGSKALGTASIFIIRELQQKQSWMSEVKKENGEYELPFVGRYSIEDKPEIVANDILRTLDIYPTRYRTDNPMREWIDKAEMKGIFISRTSFIHSKLTIDPKEIQGFAIADSYAPFVFINSKDWPAAQLFTLVHELAHIWIAETGISNEIEVGSDSRGRLHPVELFCNEVAATALMPAKLMRSFEKRTFASVNDVFAVSKKQGVSSFAFAVRAYKLNLISPALYTKLKHEANIQFRTFLEKEQQRKLQQRNDANQGGPSTYLLKLNKNGRLFTHIVLDAFNGGFVEPTLASALLSTPSNKFEKLEAQLYK